MKELIKIHNQGSELRADSRDVAKVFGIQHDSLRRLMEEHAESLAQLGNIGFEIGKLPEGPGRPEKFTYVNFDHIAFLLTLTRSTEQTKDLRLKLIIAFRDARNRLRPVDHALLSIPDVWRKTFPDDFYSALLKLYGDEFTRAENPPSWVGKWTNRFVYEPLFTGLPDELKRRRKAHTVSNGEDPFLKLHQFIEKHAKKNLESHITRVSTLLQASTSPGQFIELFTAVFYGQQQLHLLTPDVDDEFGGPMPPSRK